MVNKRTPLANQLRLINEQYDRRIASTVIKDIKVRVPKSISGSFLISLMPVGELDPKRWKESAWYVINSIIEQEDKEEYKRGNWNGRGFVPLNHLFLRHIISQEYTKKILDALTNAKVIDRDNSWSSDVVSQGYKINETHQHQGLKFRTLTNDKIVKSYSNFRAEELEKQKKRIHKHAHLVKWFLNGNLKLNMFAAIKYLHQLSIYSNLLIKDKKLEPELEEKAITLLNDSSLSAYQNIKYWGIKTASRLSVDNKGMRMHTPLTQMLSPLRNFLYYTENNVNKPLIYLDISNSQPYHLLYTLHPNFWLSEGPIILKKLNSKLSEYLRQEEAENVSLTTMMIKKKFKSSGSIATRGLLRSSDTRTKYGKLVVEGKLYKFISDEFRGQFVSKSKVDYFGNESLAKLSVIKLLYFNNKEPYSSSQKPFKKFALLFPEVAAVIKLLKSRDYADLAILLQKMESEILLRIVAKNIFKSNSNIPLYSIHDGIITTEEHGLVVKQEILNTYKQIFGVEPNLKFMELSEKAALGDIMKEAIKRTNKIFSKLES